MSRTIVYTASRSPHRRRAAVRRPAGSINAGAGVDGAAVEKSLTPNQCRKYLRKTVAGAYRDIVAGFVKEAKMGGCQHLKMATEVVQSTRRPKAVRRVKDSATLMLEKLEREFPSRKP
jgi:hypothetical protein